MSGASWTPEAEQFILRFADLRLADRLRQALREETTLQHDLDLRFPELGRHGQLTFEGKTYRIDLLDLPTVVESYKTLDDVNLVKTGDVGQVLLVGGEVGGDVSPDLTECRDGVTPPMRNARERHFKKIPQVDPKIVSQVEADLMNITSGGAPAGYEFHDVEEEYVIDPETGVGAWQRAKPAEAAPTAATGTEAAEGPGVIEEAATGEGGQPGPVRGKPKPKGPKPKKPKVTIPNDPLNE